MKTPADFYEEYNGKAIEYDKGYGIQCVGGFKVFCDWDGIPVMACPNDWAESYWTCKNTDGTINKKVQEWQRKYFDLIEGERNFIDGDWVVWPKGSTSHSLSHIAMYLQGKEFGQRQGGNGAFCLKATDFSDSFGALRPKNWSMIPEYESDLTINGHQYHMYRQAANLKAVVLSPGLNRTAPIRELDTDAYVYAKVTGCNYFQMRDDIPDQPYGTTYGDISAPLCGVYQTLPNQASTMFYDLETGEHNDCTGVTIDADHNVFSPALIYPTGKNVQYARMVGLGLCNTASMYCFVIRYKNGTYALGMTDAELTPNQIAADFASMAEVESLSIIDGGGSAQMMRYLTKERAVEYTRDTGRATAGCIAFIGAALPIETQAEPETEPTQSETKEDEEMDMTETKPAETPEIEPVEDWQDPEEKTNIIVERIAALLSVKSLITIFLTVIFGLLVLKGEELPDKFVSIYTMCISFFFGYQFKKADGGK